MASRPSLKQHPTTDSTNSFGGKQITLDGVRVSRTRPFFLAYGFLPLIDPSEDGALWHIWPEIRTGAIALNYLKLKRNPVLYAMVRSKGIRQAIGYDCKVVAVLVGENYELDKMDVASYAADLDEMGFDAATTHDDYIYPDDHGSAQWSRIHTMIDRATTLARQDPDAELIGIVQGASSLQVEFCIDSLSKIGINRYALPCSDLSARRKARRIVEFSRICRDRDAWHWLIGINSPSFMTRFPADVVSSYGWCYRGAKQKIYRDGSLVRAVSPGFCGHEICRDLSAKGLSLREVCARHNVIYLTDFMKIRGWTGQ